MLAFFNSLLRKQAVLEGILVLFWRAFGNSPQFWMNLQTHYDLKMARQNLDAKDIKRIKAQRAA